MGGSPPAAEPGGSLHRTGRIGLALGVVFFLVPLVLPTPGGMPVEAWRVAGIGLLMATWWVTEAIPIPVTALLPIVLIPLLGVASVEAATTPFANPVIFLFMGGFMLAQAMQRWGLHRRIAFAIIEKTGTGPRRLVGGFMVAAAFLSMWVSNTAVAVMMLPIGVSVLQVMRREDGPALGEWPFAVALLLGIAYGASIGGVATIIGTPPNAFLVGFLEQEFGFDIGFGRWLLIGLPVTLVLLPITWLLLTRVALRVEPEAEGLDPSVLRDFRAALGVRGRAETRVAWIFAATALAWILRPLLDDRVPGISDAGIAMGATVLLFLVPAGERAEGGRGLLDWEWARRIPWDILLLFGGGLSLAGAISASGLAEWIGTGLEGARLLPVLALMFLVTTLLVFLTELTSNTASAAAFIPILAGLALAIGVDPLLLTVPATLAASCAFMLPVATPPNAIVFGSTFIRMGHMVRAGIWLNVMSSILLPLLVYGLLGFFFEPLVVGGAGPP